MPVPSDIGNPIGREIINISARLNSEDEQFDKLARVTGNKVWRLQMKDRIELTAKLDALVAHQYGVDRNEYSYIINSFTSFREDPSLEKLTQIRWNDNIIQKFNGEVRKRVMSYYDEISEQLVG